MKFRLSFCALGLVLAASLAADDAVLSAPVVAPSAVSSSAQAVESHYLAARSAYMAGDRDTALQELSEALRLDPYHAGSTQLYQAIRSEEKTLRQVKVVPSEEAPAEAEAVAPAAGTTPGSGGSKFWRSIQNFEFKTSRRLEGVEKQVSQSTEALATLRSDVDGQKDAISQLADSQKKMAGRQDNVMLAMIAFVALMIIVLILVLKAFERMRSMRNDLSKVEFSLLKPAKPVKLAKPASSRKRSSK